MGYRIERHCVYSRHAHLVFTAKYRRDVLSSLGVSSKSLREMRPEVSGPTTGALFDPSPASQLPVKVLLSQPSDSRSTVSERKCPDRILKGGAGRRLTDH